MNRTPEQYQDFFKSRIAENKLRHEQGLPFNFTEDEVKQIKRLNQLKEQKQNEAFLKSRIAQNKLRYEQGLEFDFTEDEARQIKELNGRAKAKEVLSRVEKPSVNYKQETPDPTGVLQTFGEGFTMGFVGMPVSIYGLYDPVKANETMEELSKIFPAQGKDKASKVAGFLGGATASILPSAGAMGVVSKIGATKWLISGLYATMAGGSGRMTTKDINEANNPLSMEEQQELATLHSRWGDTGELKNVTAKTDPERMQVARYNELLEKRSVNDIGWVGETGISLGFAITEFVFERIGLDKLAHALQLRFNEKIISKSLPLITKGIKEGDIDKYAKGVRYITLDKAFALTPMLQAVAIEGTEEGLSSLFQESIVSIADPKRSIFTGDEWARIGKEVALVVAGGAWGGGVLSTGRLFNRKSRMNDLKSKLEGIVLDTDQAIEVDAMLQKAEAVALLAQTDKTAEAMEGIQTIRNELDEKGITPSNRFYIDNVLSEVEASIDEQLQQRLAEQAEAEGFTPQSLDVVAGDSQIVQNVYAGLEKATHFVETNQVKRAETTIEQSIKAIDNLDPESMSQDEAYWVNEAKTRLQETLADMQATTEDAKNERIVKKDLESKQKSLDKINKALDKKDLTKARTEADALRKEINSATDEQKGRYTEITQALDEADTKILQGLEQAKIDKDKKEKDKQAKIDAIEKQKQSDEILKQRNSNKKVVDDADLKLSEIQSKVEKGETGIARRQATTLLVKLETFVKGMTDSDLYNMEDIDIERLDKIRVQTRKTIADIDTANQTAEDAKAKERQDKEKVRQDKAEAKEKQKKEEKAKKPETESTPEKQLRKDRAAIDVVKYYKNRREISKARGRAITLLARLKSSSKKNYTPEQVEIHEKNLAETEALLADIDTMRKPKKATDTKQTEAKAKEKTEALKEKNDETIRKLKVKLDVVNIHLTKGRIKEAVDHAVELMAELNHIVTDSYSSTQKDQYSKLRRDTTTAMSNIDKAEAEAKAKDVSEPKTEQKDTKETVEPKTETATKTEKKPKPKSPKKPKQQSKGAVVSDNPAVNFLKSHKIHPDAIRTTYGDGIKLTEYLPLTFISRGGVKLQFMKEQYVEYLRSIGDQGEIDEVGRLFSDQYVLIRIVDAYHNQGSNDSRARRAEQDEIDYYKSQMIDEQYADMDESQIEQAEMGYLEDDEISIEEINSILMDAYFDSIDPNNQESLMSYDEYVQLLAENSLIGEENESELAKLDAVLDNTLVNKDTLVETTADEIAPQAEAVDTVPTKLKRGETYVHNGIEIGRDDIFSSEYYVADPLSAKQASALAKAHDAKQSKHGDDIVLVFKSIQEAIDYIDNKDKPIVEKEAPPKPRNKTAKPKVVSEIVEILEVVSNPNTTSDVLMSHINSKYEGVRSAIANNPNLSSEGQEMLKDDKDEFVRMALAGNWIVDADILSYLSKDTSDNVLIALVHNSSIPSDVMLSMSEGEATKEIVKAFKQGAEAKQEIDKLKKKSKWADDSGAIDVDLLLGTPVWDAFMKVARTVIKRSAGDIKKFGRLMKQVIKDLDDGVIHRLYTDVQKEYTDEVIKNAKLNAIPKNEQDPYFFPDEAIRLNKEAIRKRFGREYSRERVSRQEQYEAVSNESNLVETALARASEMVANPSEISINEKDFARIIIAETVLLGKKDEITKSIKNGEYKGAKLQQMQAEKINLFDKINLLADGARIYGTVAGGALQSLQVGLERDGITINMIKDIAESAKGKALSNQEMANLIKLVEEYQEVEDQLRILIDNRPNREQSFQKVDELKRLDQRKKEVIVKLRSASGAVKSRFVAEYRKILADAERVQGELSALQTVTKDLPKDVRVVVETLTKVAKRRPLDELKKEHKEVTEAIAKSLGNVNIGMDPTVLYKIGQLITIEMAINKISLENAVAKLRSKFTNLDDSDINSALGLIAKVSPAKMKRFAEGNLKRLQSIDKLLKAIHSELYTKHDPDYKGVVYKSVATILSELSATHLNRHYVSDVMLQIDNLLGIVDVSDRPNRIQVVAEFEALKSLLDIDYNISKTNQGINKGNYESIHTPIFKSANLSKEELIARVKLDTKKKALLTELRKIRQVNQESKTWALFKGTQNTLRILKASGDFGATFSQGLFSFSRLLITNPVLAGKMFASQVKSFGSEQYYDDWMAQVKQVAIDAGMVQDGLWLSELEDLKADLKALDATSREELFQANWIEDLPYLGQYVKGSNRAYTGMLNALRVTAGMNYMVAYPNATTLQRQLYFRFVNVLSGRGEMSRDWASGLSIAFFAPRFALSRFQMYPMAISFAMKDKEVGKMIFKDLLAGTAFRLLMHLLIAIWTGQKMYDMNVWRSNWGKAMIKEISVDFGAGMATIERFLIRALATGGYQTPITAKLLEKIGVPEPEWSFDYLRQAQNMLIYKLAPAWTTSYSLLSGKTIVGEEQSRYETLIRSVIPMTMEDAISAAFEQDNGTVLDGALAFGLSAVGARVNYINKSIKARRKDVMNDVKYLIRDGKHQEAQTKIREWNDKVTKINRENNERTMNNTIAYRNILKSIRDKERKERQESDE